MEFLIYPESIYFSTGKDRHDSDKEILFVRLFARLSVVHAELLNEFSDSQTDGHAYKLYRNFNRSNTRMSCSVNASSELGTACLVITRKLCYRKDYRAMRAI